MNAINGRPFQSAVGRRGLTLLEMMLALTITAMVALAISGMMGAVSSGLANRADARTLMIAGHTAQSRIGAYIAPARCLLDVDDHELVIWLDDGRDGETVHATELRWLVFDSDEGALKLYFVNLPDAWPDYRRDIADREYGPGENWTDVFDHYNSNNWLSHRTLIDDLVAVEFRAPSTGTVLDARQVISRLTFEGTGMHQDVTVSSTIRRHRKPESK